MCKIEAFSLILRGVKAHQRAPHTPRTVQAACFGVDFSPRHGRSDGVQPFASGDDGNLGGNNADCLYGGK